MQIGMNLLLWTVHPTVRAHGTLIEQLKSWGFDGVEFPLGSNTQNEIRELAKLCDDLGLGRTALQGFDAAVAEPTSADDTLRTAALDELKRGIDKTLALGSDLLSGPFFQGQGGRLIKPPTHDDWLRSVEVVQQGAEYAADHGVRIALEPLYRFEMSLVNTLADASRYCRDTGMSNVGLLADTHHSNIEEENTATAWRDAASHIFHVHISENHRGIPGSGHAIGPEIFQTLHDVGYDNWLTIEAFSPKVEPLVPRLRIWREYFQSEDEVAIDGLRFIRKNWNRVRSE
jgi:D-psicose/D-tagatose/L-ribulose 3-epimerase